MYFVRIFTLINQNIFFYISINFLRQNQKCHMSCCNWYIKEGWFSLQQMSWFPEDNWHISPSYPLSRIIGEIWRCTPLPGIEIWWLWGMKARCTQKYAEPEENWDGGNNKGLYQATGQNGQKTVWPKKIILINILY